ncbi:hypothetical protein OOK40_20560 [Streptomyces sp. NBC_01481]|nr:hypothetical protein [Streptomyces sp. NBC_01481]
MPCGRCARTSRSRWHPPSEPDHQVEGARQKRSPVQSTPRNFPKRGAGVARQAGRNGPYLCGLYEEHGEDPVGHLRRMFAFAIWDTARRRPLLARDRVGKKPLYYRVFEVERCVSFVT